MLSQIENGAASPSMDTLRQLAARLKKPVSYFLEEDTLTSPNQAVMTKARQAFQAGSFSSASAVLGDYQTPDGIFDPEYYLLTALCRMELARQAIDENRLPYAAALLEQALEAFCQTPYFTPVLARERLLLLASTGAAVELPADDRGLLLRAEKALALGDPRRSLQLLDAAQEQAHPRWQLLRGNACFAAGDYEAAAHYLSQAESTYPQHVLQHLEICYRELKDFEKAYTYACKQRHCRP
jgi:transcriptional regulator with XRE-family HTH domain